MDYSRRTTWFFHADHLGSPKVKTAVNGMEAERWDHYPYGETWVPGAPGDQHRYTGHLRDAESDNEYAGARYYANQRGRWLSVDPVPGNLSNPQRLNRYAYVLGNPVNWFDPGGANPVSQCHYVLRLIGRNGDYSGVFMYSCGNEPGRPTETTKKEGGWESRPASKPELETFDTERFRDLGEKFILNELSDNCKRFLESQGFPVGSLLQTLRTTRFWRVPAYSMKEVSSLPGVVGPFSRNLLGEFSHPWAGAAVVTNIAGEFFPHVVFGGQFKNGLAVFHEVMHIVSQWGDLEMANRWYLGAYNDDRDGISQASQAVTKFFDPKDWDCGAGIVGWPAP